MAQRTPFARLLVLAALLGGCHTQKPQPAAQYRFDPGATAAAPLKVVLVAGDGSLPVWDNATARMQALLVSRAGVPLDAIRLLSARGDAVRAGQEPATAVNVLRAVAAMGASPGQHCLMYPTAHGARDGGLYMAASDQLLEPYLFDEALRRGCGNAPTVVILSGCYSGYYLHDPMLRPNRLILTAAREDRTSFGCGAGFTYTVFDECLLDSMAKAEAGSTWAATFEVTRKCVSTNEYRQHAVPSEPQSFAGADAAALRLPWDTAGSGG